MRPVSIRPLQALALVVLAGACRDVRGQEGRPSQDTVALSFERNPPRVEEASVQLLPAPREGRNAVLIVRYAPDRRLGRTVTLFPDSQSVVLRDDGEAPDRTAGDRVYAGLVRVDADSLGVHTRRLSSQAEVPVFEQRRLVRRTTLRELAGRETALAERQQAAPLLFIGVPQPVNEDRSLLIRDPGVIGDPTRTWDPCTRTGNANGVWSFPYLMTQMANQQATGVDPRQFARRWLQKWLTPQVVNGWTVPARPQVQLLLTEWQLASRGTFDLSYAPFKLIAIVNRVDLRGNSSYGGGNAGEGRFVFELVRRSNQCRPLPFTVILEYGVPLRGCPAVRGWGQAWLNLSGLTPGSAQYNARLEQLTQRFARANADPRKPNGSALNQLRTNEIHLARPWELREFTIARGGPQPGHLAMATVKQTPGDARNRTPVLAQYVNANAAAIQANTYTVPNGFPPPANPRFLGGSSQVPSLTTTFWDGPPPPPSAAITGPPNTRHLFSLGTCNACHGPETSTRFQHITTFASPQVSGFLTGITVPDPAGEGVSRTFDDLLRRAQDLEALANTLCIAQIRFQPLNFTH
jgi:hypothetical protein